MSINIDVYNFEFGVCIMLAHLLVDVSDAATFTHTSLCLFFFFSPSTIYIYNHTNINIYMY